MRSNLVFTARSRVSNPFLLCHFVRLATKAFHKNGVAVPETINKILTAVGKQDCAAEECAVHGSSLFLYWENQSGIRPRPASMQTGVFPFDAHEPPVIGCSR